MECLLHRVVEHVAGTPRAHCFTVGDHLLTACLDIIENLVDAAYRRDKHASLAAASRGLVRARIRADRMGRCAGWG